MNNEHQKKKNLQSLLFILILILGIFVRVWKFGSLPPGLNKDEASIAVDAASLLYFGVDRHGISFPVHFISWGSGQNALYGYLLIPFIALFGLSSTVIRLPMLITGIMSLPLVYLLGKATEDENLGLLAMFFIAISPWHIILSRWGLEANILPFVFLLSFVLLLKSIEKNAWYSLACIIFGLCLYAYGTAYAFIPIFMFFGSGLILYKKQLSIKPFLFGIICFVIIAIPIFLFIIVNSMKMESIHLFSVTIPRLPSIPRYETISSIFQNDFINLVKENFYSLIVILIGQSDGNVINVVKPYGYFYTITFPLVVLGMGRLVLKLKEKNGSSIKILILLWIAASLFVGLIQPVNTNRINIIFIPLIFCIAVFFYGLNKKNHFVIPVTSMILLLACGLFMHDYQGERYLNGNRVNFFIGLVPAIQYANSINEGEICISNQYHGVYPMPYVYVLMAKPMDPARYLVSTVYVDPHADFLEPRSMGRYYFGMENCTSGPLTVYIFHYKDDISLDFGKYEQWQFDDYLVFSPNGY